MSEDMTEREAELRKQVEIVHLDALNEEARANDLERRLEIALRVMGEDAFERYIELCEEGD